MALKPAYAKVRLNGESGNEDISNDGPERPDGDDRAIAREGMVEHQVPPRPRVRDELVRGIALRPLRPKGSLILHFDSGHRAEVSAQVKALAV